MLAASPRYAAIYVDLYQRESNARVVQNSWKMGREALKEWFMRTNLIVSGFMFAFILAQSAQAQVTIDASKITCDQYVHGKVGEPRIVAAWLSGFYNGKRDNAVIDKQNFQANLNKLERFCFDNKNFSVPVMQAIERAIGSAK